MGSSPMISSKQLAEQLVVVLTVGNVSVNSGSMTPAFAGRTEPKAPSAIPSAPNTRNLFLRRIFVISPFVETVLTYANTVPGRYGQLNQPCIGINKLLRRKV